MGRWAQFELSHLDGSSIHPIMIPLLGGQLAKATVIPLFGCVSPLWFSPSTVSTMITSFNGPIYIIQWLHHPIGYGHLILMIDSFTANSHTTMLSCIMTTKTYETWLSRPSKDQVGYRAKRLRVFSKFNTIIATPMGKCYPLDSNRCVISTHMVESRWLTRWYNHNGSINPQKCHMSLKWWEKSSKYSVSKFKNIKQSWQGQIIVYNIYQLSK